MSEAEIEQRTIPGTDLEVRQTRRLGCTEVSWTLRHESHWVGITPEMGEQLWGLEGEVVV